MDVPTFKEVTKDKFKEIYFRFGGGDYSGNPQRISSTRLNDGIQAPRRHRRSVVTTKTVAQKARVKPGTTIAVLESQMPPAVASPAPDSVAGPTALFDSRLW